MPVSCAVHGTITLKYHGKLCQLLPPLSLPGLALIIRSSLQKISKISLAQTPPFQLRLRVFHFYAQTKEKFCLLMRRICFCFYLNLLDITEVLWNAQRQLYAWKKQRSYLSCQRWWQARNHSAISNNPSHLLVSWPNCVILLIGAWK